MKTNIKKAILEAEKRKETILIETEIAKHRILSVMGEIKTKKDFNSLSENKKLKLLFSIANEFNTIEESVLQEQDLGGIFKSLLGNLFGGSTVETLAEPFVNRILSAIGLEGYWKNFLISALTGNPVEFLRAFSDCRKMTRLISESLVEGWVMTLQKTQGFGGFMYDLLRNVLGDTIKDNKFVQGIENGLGDVVCSLFEKFSTNASKLLPAAA